MRLVGLTIALAGLPRRRWPRTRSLRGTTARPKQAILVFVEATTQRPARTSSQPAARIAVFDQDGTLWAEQPMYSQLLFGLERVKALAPEHPEEDQGAVRRAAQGDRAALATGSHDRRDRHGHARGYDDRRVRAERQELACDREASELQAALHRARLISRWSSCSPICGRTATRPFSSPAAASISCAGVPKRSTAFRPNRSSAPRQDEGRYTLRQDRQLARQDRRSTSSTTRPASRRHSPR